MEKYVLRLETKNKLLLWCHAVQGNFFKRRKNIFEYKFFLGSYSRLQTVPASIVSSQLCWSNFEIRQWTKNMRLMGLNDGPDNLNEEQIRILRQQEEYGKMILAIGRGAWRGDNCISEDKQTGRQERRTRSE